MDIVFIIRIPHLKMNFPVITCISDAFQQVIIQLTEHITKKSKM